MPVVTVDWVAGRTIEQRRELATRITAAVADVGGLEPPRYGSSSTTWPVKTGQSAADWSPTADLPAASPTRPLGPIQFPGNSFGVKRPAYPVGQLSPLSRLGAQDSSRAVAVAKPHRDLVARAHLAEQIE